MPTNLQSVKQWYFEKMGWRSMTIEEAVDVIISCFTKEQMQILDSTHVPENPRSHSFRRVLLAEISHKNPTHTIEEYRLMTCYAIYRHQHMFDDPKVHAFTIRDALRNKFSKFFS